MELNKPRFLVILCFLSFVNGIYGVLTGLMNAVSPPDVTEDLIQEVFEALDRFPVPYENFSEAMHSYTVNTLLSTSNIGALTFLFSSISLIGVYNMFVLNKNGFYFYIIAQIGLAIGPVFFGGFNLFGVMTMAMGLLWNGIWILLYGLNLKHMKR